MRCHRTLSPCCSCAAADLSHLPPSLLLLRREGATLHLNGTRPGSEETDLSAEDLYSSAPISATLVSGPSLIDEGAGDQVGNGNASDPDSMFSRIELARAVAPGAEARVRINKTYEDPLSYWVEDDGSVV